MNRNEILRSVSLAAAFAGVLMASSCVAPTGANLTPDPDANHPITVAPVYRTLKLSFATPAAGLLPQDEARFESFVAHYKARGNGSVSISVPKGPDSAAVVRYFGERLAAMGVPRSHILVGRHDIVDGDGRIALSYISYQASTDPCGDWSADFTSTSRNEPYPNFGCSTQHNLAAMVEDPRDLLKPRTLGAGNAMRRTDVMEKYEQGVPTAATKTADQSAAITTQ